MDLTQFITWLASSAGASAVAAFLLERLPVFQAQPPARKPWIVYLVSVALALTAYAVQTYVPAEALAQLAPVFAIIAALTVPFVATQLAHANDPAAFKTVTSDPPAPPDAETVADIRARR